MFPIFLAILSTVASKEIFIAYKDETFNDYVGKTAEKHFVQRFGFFLKREVVESPFL